MKPGGRLQALSGLGFETPTDPGPRKSQHAFCSTLALRGILAQNVVQKLPNNAASCTGHQCKVYAVYARLQAKLTDAAASVSNGVTVSPSNLNLWGTGKENSCIDPLMFASAGCA